VVEVEKAEELEEAGELAKVARSWRRSWRKGVRTYLFEEVFERPIDGNIQGLHEASAASGN
jgi:hypothetical protein